MDPLSEISGSIEVSFGSVTSAGANGAPPLLFLGPAPEAPRHLPPRITPEVLALVERFLARPGELEPRTVSTYRREILTFLSDLAGEPMTRDRVKAYVAALLEGGPARPPLKRTSVQLRLAATRVFFKELVLEGVIPFNPVDGVRVKVRPRDQEPASVLSRAEVEAILAAPPTRTPDGRPNVVGLRDRALLRVGFLLGLRRSELAGLRVGDLGRDEGTQIPTLQVRTAKGGKVLSLPLRPDVEQAIAEYLDFRVRRGSEAPLFAASKRREGATEAALHPRRIDHIVRSWALDARITKVVSPHSMRATFATLASIHAPISRIQQALGHSSVAMAARYVRPAEDLREHPTWQI